jgi:hypothetical protein
MKTIQKLTALVFLVLWVPVTAHCSLEKVPGLEFLQCASDTAGDSNCEGDSCQTIESGFYKISDNTCIVRVPAFYVILFTVPSQTVIQHLSAHPCPRTQSSFPPDLPQSWQFISRTALPVRAPSIVS